MFEIYFIPKDGHISTSEVCKTQVYSRELAQQVWDTLNQNFKVLNQRP